MNGDLVIGIGSPHGDDQAGWCVIDHLQAHPALEASIRAVGDPVDVLEHIIGVQRLVLVDACHSGQPAGTIFRWDALNDVLRGDHGLSSHRLSIPQMLKLGLALGRLPPRVILYGVEVGPCQPQTEISPAVKKAIPAVASQILRELKATP